jgi:hypothetical protein
MGHRVSCYRYTKGQIIAGLGELNPSETL